MKTIPVSLIFFAILSAHVAAEPAPRVKPDAKPNAKNLKHQGGNGGGERWKSADANADGMVSYEEFGNMPRIVALPEERRRAVFKRLDRNGDAMLQKVEIWKDPRMETGSGGKEMGRNQLWQLDADQSRSISYAEFSAGRMIAKLPEQRRKAMFDRLDTDHSGEISESDKPVHPPKSNKAAKGRKSDARTDIWSLDKNKDTAISFDEFCKGRTYALLSEDEQEDRFEALDKNKDLVITRADFAEAKPTE
jgi:Ca2+-binding EF-hand superfamily protein